MGLYELSGVGLKRIDETSFAAEHVLERTHLQAAVRDNISLLGDDLLVVAEEFGEFEDTHRRIDLLCVDRSGCLVVVELKRTHDGGHMELQALRYAAMVSTMTLVDLVAIYRHHLVNMKGDPDSAETTLIDWLDDNEDGTEPVLRRDVRIILVSGGFGKEITTAVLWLRDLYDLDIRCIRLTPYRVDQRLLLDVQQIVPLPEAAELMVQLRRRERVAKAAATSSKDYTRFIVTSPKGSTEPLPKRRAIREMVCALHQAGVACESLNAVLPNAKFLAVDGELEDDELIEAFVATYPVAERNLHRWFFDSPLHDQGRTWVLSKMWGPESKAVLTELSALGDGQITFAAR